MIQNSTDANGTKQFQTKILCHQAALNFINL